MASCDNDGDDDDHINICISPDDERPYNERAIERRIARLAFNEILKTNTFRNSDTPAGIAETNMKVSDV